MDQLLDDVLVLVMTRLSVEDVFTCRLVCKRLAALALHPDVWRNRVFKKLRMGRDKCLLCPVLRLAPCLRTLALRLCSYDTTPHRSSEITCGVRKLRLSVDPAGVELAVYFIRRFAALGRLRVICLDWDTFEHAYEDEMWPAAALLRELAATPGLDELELITSDMDIGPVDYSGPSTPSLKSFYCGYVDDEIEGFHSFMLEHHASTLEAVEFELDTEYVCPRGGPLARLLAGMPRLRQLTCPLIPGMEKLAASSSLRELKLVVDPYYPPTVANVPRAVELLRSAAQLRSVHLQFFYSARPHSYGTELVRGLVSSGQCLVESLTVEVMGSVVSLPPMPSDLRWALPSLPALRRLDVNLPSAELLLAITPDSAPSLRSLQLDAYSMIDSVYEGPDEITEWWCSDAMLHSASVKSLLAANPLLHVKLPTRCDSYKDSILSCKPCNKGCETRIKKVLDTFNLHCVGVYAHPVGECPYPEDHSSDVLWFHITDMEH